MNATTIERAMELTKEFKTKPNNEELLKLYGLYKQAKEGDNKEEPPSSFDFVAAAKHKAWSNNNGKSKEEAQSQYIAFVNSISSKYI